MLNRFRDRGLNHPQDEMNRLFGQVFGGLMGPAESNQRVPIVVGA